MITTLKLRAYGKINLALDVLRKREDGYHDVRMIKVLSMGPKRLVLTLAIRN